MTDLRDKIETECKECFGWGWEASRDGDVPGEEDASLIIADRIIEIMREALLTEDTLKELVLNLGIKPLADGKTQLDAAAGMHVALETAGATRRNQTIEDFIEGK